VRRGGLDARSTISSSVSPGVDILTCMGQRFGKLMFDYVTLHPKLIQKQ
jgi:hypothetical protein